MRIYQPLVLLLILALLEGCSAGKYRAPIYERGKTDQAEEKSADEKDWRPEVYVVQKGDTMYSIAFNYGYDYHELAELNGIKDPTLISIGQQIKLFPGRAPSEVPDAAEIKPVENLLKDQPKLVKYNYSEKALVLAAKVQDEVSPIVTTITRVDNKPKPEIDKPIAVSSADVAKDADLNWGMPAQGNVIARFSESANRKGIDIAGKLGQPILASAAGKVVYSGSGLRGYGKLIIIKHNSTYLSAYAHNDKIHVKEGQSVSRGQKIAEMGRTDADQVKLHFEVRRLGKPVDPAKYLPL